MIGKWNLPLDVCHTHPLTRDIMDLFVGRDDLVKKIRQNLHTGGVILIEGEIGRGKTSLGNVCRMGDKTLLSPDLELQSEPDWNKDLCLRQICASLRLSMKTHPELKRLPVDAEINKKLKDGIAPGMDPQTRLDMIHDVTKELLNISNQSKLVLQMNNLDLNLVFSESQMDHLLNMIRDLFYIPGISWILCGHWGLSSFIKKKVRRVNDAISLKVSLNALSQDEVLEILQKRSGSTQFPMSEDLIGEVYQRSGTSLRETFSILQELLYKFGDDPLIEDIERENIISHYSNEMNYFAKKRGRQKEVFTFICSNSGLSQKELCELSGIDQTAFSKIVKELEDDEVIRLIRDGKEIHHFPSARFYFAHLASSST